MHCYRCYFLSTWNRIIGAMTLHDVERCVGKSGVLSLR
jgi:hypothetical protein